MKYDCVCSSLIHVFFVSFHVSHQDVFNWTQESLEGVPVD